MTNPTTEQSSGELSPCPFCGAPASGYAIEPHTHALFFAGVELPDHSGSYVIEGDCQCGSGLIGATQEEVTARWNRRSAPMQQAAELSEEQVMTAIKAASAWGRLFLTYVSGPYDIERPTNVAMTLARAILAAAAPQKGEAA